jgi:hypothetical protein
MYINKELEAAIHDRGVAFIPTIAEAITERKEATAHLDRLIDVITPEIGPPRRRDGGGARRWARAGVPHPASGEGGGAGLDQRPGSPRAAV